MDDGRIKYKALCLERIGMDQFGNVIGVDLNGMWKNDDDWVSPVRYSVFVVEGWRPLG